VVEVAATSIWVVEANETSLWVGECGGGVFSFLLPSPILCVLIFFFISSFCFPFPNLISLISFLLILTYLLFNFRFICLWQG
jgi:hypothetical protein